MGLRLKAELDGDGSGFQRMMNNANERVGSLGKNLFGLRNIIAAAFSIGAISSLTRKTIDFASHLRDVSDALRVNVEWFQKRANAARLAGGSEDDLFKFIDTMNKSREEAFQKPGEAMSQRFSRLGFSQSDIGSLSTADFFDRIVKSFGEGATAQTAVDVENVGGRSARNLLAAFYNHFKSDAEIISEDIIDQLDDIGDQFTILGNLLMVKLAPAIAYVSQKLMSMTNLPAQLGTGLGRAVGNAEVGLENDKGKSSIAKGANFVTRLLTGYVTGVVDEAQKQDSEKAAMVAAKLAERAARKARERGGPGFVFADANEKEKARRSPNLPSDGTAAVGGFLGRNPGLVNSIANQQLSVAKEQLKVLNEIKMAFKNAAIFQSAARAGIQVPPG